MRSPQLRWIRVEGYELLVEIPDHMAFHDEVAGDGPRRCFRVVTRNRWIEDEPGKGRSVPVAFTELCFEPRDLVLEPKTTADSAD